LSFDDDVSLVLVAVVLLLCLYQKKIKEIQTLQSIGSQLLLAASFFQ